MKKISTLLLVAIFSMAFFGNQIKAQVVSENLSLEPGYTNDIFYSLTDGEVSNISRAGWDIAFYTNAFSAGIIINEGAGVSLYNYPNGDTAAWANFDTTNMSSWTPLYNSNEYWEDGAFNRAALGHPDYGWGIYNAITHGLTGDSLYLINSPEAGLKKLWIVDKVSVDDIYHIKYADIDGSNEQTVELDLKPYTAKNFAYYSLVTNELIDREPEADWDIMFTKYMDLTPDNEGNMVPYLVTGATSNINRYANKFYPVADDYNDWSAQPFDSLKNVIGYNWKSFDMGSFQWVVEDSTTFFMMNTAGDVYKIVFTAWEGSTTGAFSFDKEMVHASSVFENNDNNIQLNVYPNPASQFINIKSDITEGNIILTDIQGREVMQFELIENTSIDISQLPKGLYFVNIIGENLKGSTKFIVK